MAARIFWIKDDGSYEESDFFTTRSWVKLHPNKHIRIVELMPKQVLIYSLGNDGSHYDFDGARIDKNVLAQILKELI